MKGLINRVSLTGRLGQDPKLQTVGNGFQLVKFSLATNEKYKDKAGKWMDNTQWHNVVVWGPVAEKLSKTTIKGEQIHLEGRLVQRSYEKDGEKRYVSEVEMSDFMNVILKKENIDNASNDDKPAQK